MGQDFRSHEMENRLFSVISARPKTTMTYLRALIWRKPIVFDRWQDLKKIITGSRKVNIKQNWKKNTLENHWWSSYIFSISTCAICVHGMKPASSSLSRRIGWQISNVYAGPGWKHPNLRTQGVIFHMEIRHDALSLIIVLHFLLLLLTKWICCSCLFIIEK